MKPPKTETPTAHPVGATGGPTDAPHHGTQVEGRAAASLGDEPPRRGDGATAEREAVVAASPDSLFVGLASGTRSTGRTRQGRRVRAVHGTGREPTTPDTIAAPEPADEGALAHNDGFELGVLPRVKSNTDMAKAKHSGWHDRPVILPLELPTEPPPSERPVQDPTTERSSRPGQTGLGPRTRTGRRIAQVSARLKQEAQEAVEELRRFPIEQAVTWFLVGVAVALSVLVATS